MLLITILHLNQPEYVSFKYKCCRLANHTKATNLTKIVGSTMYHLNAIIVANDPEATKAPPGLKAQC